MTRAKLEIFLGELGVPAKNVETIASQLEKRARQLSEKRSQSYEESLAHLVFLLKQGWAAKQGKKTEVGGGKTELPNDGLPAIASAKEGPLDCPP